MTPPSSDTERAPAGPIERLRAVVEDVAAAMRGGGSEAPPPTLERPPRAEFGDFSTNVAMLLAPALKAPPREIAERVGAELGTGLGVELERAEVAGPGFLNLFLSDAWFRNALEGLREQGDRFAAGVLPPAERERILVEFVSANPTGPLTAASGRHAAYGDSLARVLELAGHEVEREYYVNDEGTQIELFGRSIAARMRGEPVPEGGYQGDYVDRAGRAAAQRGHRSFRPRLAHPPWPGADAGRGACHARALPGAVRPLLLGALSARRRPRSTRRSRCSSASGHVYTSEGATWLRTTAFGDDKDRVLRRSSGEFAYFAPDIAYHLDKLKRGHDRMLDVWGADHHGHVLRMRAAFEALGEGGKLEMIIMQLVHIVERGERSKMSKRRGDFVTLDELIDDIGVDAARFFMVERSHDTTLDLDVDLARERSQENPVYYVQYAHARIAAILRNAGEERVNRAREADLARGLRAARARGTHAREAAARAARGGARDGRAPGAAPAHRLRPRRRLGLPRVLPRLPRGGRRAG